MTEFPSPSSADQEGQGQSDPPQASSVPAQRGAGGKFKKLSNAERIRRLHKKGMKNSEIAKKLGIRPQVVHRALNRSKSNERVTVGKDMIAAQLERLKSEDDDAGTGECDERCQMSMARTCECSCGGVNHGIANRV